MGREIKFRAWDPEISRMGKVDEIDFKRKKCWFDWYESPTRLGHYIAYFENIQLMQYTGLRDRNGREVYEGDIIHINGINPQRPREIKWHGSGWHCFLGGDALYKFDLDPDDFEVIGNIYEHPHLLPTSCPTEKTAEIKSIKSNE